MPLHTLLARANSPVQCAYAPDDGGKLSASTMLDAFPKSAGFGYGLGLSLPLQGVSVPDPPRSDTAKRLVCRASGLLQGTAQASVLPHVARDATFAHSAARRGHNKIYTEAHSGQLNQWTSLISM